MVWILLHEYLVYANSDPVLNLLCFSPFNQADCEAINGYLVEVNTEQEADFVLANIIRKLFSFQRIYGNYIYMYIYLYMAPWQRFAVSLKKIIMRFLLFGYFSIHLGMYTKL